jgi:ferredoxin
MSSRLRVDWTRCDGHGLCAELVPELVMLDDWGYPVIDPQGVPAELEQQAAAAVRACPTLALILSPAATGSSRSPDAGKSRAGSARGRQRR